MIVVAIIGILASVAIPGFQEYVLNAKMAEAYVGMNHIRQGQLVHFYQNDYFIRPQGSGGALTIGQKYTVAFSGDVDYFGWDLIGGYPVSEGSQSYFSYHSRAGYTDSSGDTYRHFVSGIGDSDFTSGTYNGNPRVAHTGGDNFCAIVWSDEGFGINQLPNEHWHVNFASAKFQQSNPDVCTMVIQITKVQGGGVTSSPMILVNKGM